MNTNTWNSIRFSISDSKDLPIEDNVDIMIILGLLRSTDQREITQKIRFLKAMEEAFRAEGKKEVTLLEAANFFKTTPTQEQEYLKLREKLIHLQQKKAKSFPEPRLKDAKNYCKGLLPVFLASGIYEVGQRKSKETVVGHTGCVILDFDHVVDTGKIKAFAKKDPHTLLAFTSPSGDGVKLLVQTDFKAQKDELSTDRLHQAVVNKVINIYEAKLASYGITDFADLSGVNINRLCYLPYDRAPVFNPQCTPLTIDRNALIETLQTKKKPIPTKASDVVKDYEDLFTFCRALADKRQKTEGTHNYIYFNFANYCNRVGIPFDIAYQYCCQEWPHKTLANQQAGVVYAYKSRHDHATWGLSKIITLAQEEGISLPPALSFELKKNKKGFVILRGDKAQIPVPSFIFSSHAIQQKGKTSFYKLPRNKKQEVINEIISRMSLAEGKEVIQQKNIQPYQIAYLQFFLQKTKLPIYQSIYGLFTVNQQENPITIPLSKAFKLYGLSKERTQTLLENIQYEKQARQKGWLPIKVANGQSVDIRNGPHRSFLSLLDQDNTSLKNVAIPQEFEHDYKKLIQAIAQDPSNFFPEHYQEVKPKQTQTKISMLEI